MMQKDVETVALWLVAMGLMLVVLLAIADTPAYPIAFGIEIVAILYYVLGTAQKPAADNVNQIVQSFTTFVQNPGKYAQ